MILAIIILSLLIQLAAALVAVWLIRISGGKLAWFCITAALLLMAVRRSIALYLQLAGNGAHTPEVWAELIGLLLSLFMLIGLAGIGPLFKKIRSSEDRWRDAEYSLRDMLENVEVIAVMLDLTGKIIFCNNYFIHLTGWIRAEVMGLNWFDTFLPPEQRETLRSLFLEQMTREGMPARYRNEIITWRGERRLIDWHNTPLHDSAGKIIGGTSIGVDVTEQVRAEVEIGQLNTTLESRVAERTAELEASNRELEAFCYSVSHDLRAPLRAIDGFSALAQEESGAALSASCKEYLQRMGNAAVRMGRLIDDLLNLARVSRRALQRRSFNVSELCTEVVEELVASDPARPVRFLIAQGVAATGDPRLVRQVVQNLLENAWKFTAKKAEAIIEFGVRDGAGDPVYFVKDNGAGFNMAFSRKLFGTFQRLHHENEFAGTGIGLATVERIIERHGGQVWAEGQEGEGATFFFTLPAEQPV